MAAVLAPSGIAENMPGYAAHWVSFQLTIAQVLLMQREVLVAQLRMRNVVTCPHINNSIVQGMFLS